MKVLVVGCGGIGSYLVQHINEAFVQEQISGVDVSIADNDTVELKNIQYQNFTGDDVMENKASCLVKRYEFIDKAVEKRITKKDLDGYDVYMIAVDNFQARKDIIEYCHDNNKFFIDLRAEGRNVFAMTKGNKRQEDLVTINPNDNQEGSCQHKWDLDRGQIEYGNLVIATIGVQLFMNYIRLNEQGRRILLRV